MGKRTVVHGSFSVDRYYPASPERVFAAFGTAEARAQWMHTWKGQHLAATHHTLDFWPGGIESFECVGPSGHRYRYVGRFYDIVAPDRLVYAYEMYQEDVRISVSLASVQLTRDRGGTQLVYTEQGVFLDGLDGPATREAGVADELAALEQVAFLRS